LCEAGRGRYCTNDRALRDAVEAEAQGRSERMQAIIQVRIVIARNSNRINENGVSARTARTNSLCRQVDRVIEHYAVTRIADGKSVCRVVIAM
jgi:hypothetical protein